MVHLSSKRQTHLLFLLDIITPTALLYTLTQATNTEWHNQYLALSILATILNTTIFQLKNLYKPITEQDTIDNILTISMIWLSNFFISMSIAFIFSSPQTFSVKIIISWIILTLTIISLIRLMLKAVIHKPTTHFLIIGNQYRFTPFERDRLKKRKIQLHTIKNPKDSNQLKQIIEQKTKQQGCCKIVLNEERESPKAIRLFVHQELRGVQFYTFEHFMEKYLNKCFTSNKEKKLNYLDEIKPYNKKQLFIKRVIDYSIALTLLIFTLPIIIYSAYRIKKESPNGPIFFKQKRVGKSAKEFECIKFRSMIPDAENGKPQFASNNDPRVYKWGEIMRKTRIDELPQLINVLKGEMHLIGPRPERKYWIEQFEKEIPYYNERHLVAPGITGWAQVMYPYGANTEDAKQKLMYDLYYIKNWSLALEIKTAIKTTLVIIGRKGL